MRIVKKYSFNAGLKLLGKDKARELEEVLDAVKAAKAEKTKAGLYSPKAMSNEILSLLYRKGWEKPKTAFGPPGSLIEGDAAKNGVGVEIQFGKYSFLGWDSLRKMAVFAGAGAYSHGIEIAPMASLRRRMDKGVGSFEQLSGKLKSAGNAELKIPVVVLGIDA